MKNEVKNTLLSDTQHQIPVTYKINYSKTYLSQSLEKEYKWLQHGQYLMSAIDKTKMLKKQFLKV